jgi:putative endonuclease
MSRQSIDLGKAGEEAAIEFLEGKGFRILQRNFKCALGEIDIIAKDKGTICFIEVKTRAGLNKGLPQEAITRAKQRKLSQVALSFLKSRNLLDSSARFDIVCILYGRDATQIELLQDAFELNARYSY